MTAQRIRSILQSLLTVISLLVVTPVLAQTGLDNPIGSSHMTLADLVFRLTRSFIGGIGIFAVFAFAYGGVLMVIARGNSEMITKAKDTIIWSILGLATLILSYSFMKFVWDVLITPIGDI